MDGYKRRTEEASFTTMCMVMDDSGRVAALNKIKGGYYGLTFPGGHVEEGESLYDCVIREVREEAGIEIRKPVLRGIYHWMDGKLHNQIFLYSATEYSGELKGSDEGEVCWIPLDDFRKMELAQGMQEVIEICSGGGARECHMVLEDGEYKGYMY